MKIFTVIMALMISVSAMAADSKKYKFGFSHYTSWDLLNASDVIKKHADKHGVKIEMVLINDYVESLNLLAAGNTKPSGTGSIDIVVVTNVDGISTVAAAASTKNPIEVILVNSYSAGNDKIVSKSAKTMKDLKGKKLQLVEYSVSHYLLARALSVNGMKESDLGGIVNTSDVDIQANYLSLPPQMAHSVTWNPMAQSIAKEARSTVLFDSSKIPGEILDLTVTRSDVPDAVKQAVADAWAEIAASVAPNAPGRTQVIERVAKFSGCSVADYEAQLKTTAMFYDQKDAAAVFKDPKLKETMKYVRDFSYDKGLLGKGAKDSTSIQYPDGTVLGDAKSVKMKFVTKYMEAASQTSKTAKTK